MAALVLALLLTAQAAPASEATQVDPLLIQPKGWLGGPVPTEENIIRSLNQLVLDEPDRVVCIPRETTGTRRKLNQCATLQHWYDFNMDRDIPRKIAKIGHPTQRAAFINDARPPYELVHMLTERYRDPKARERISVRATTSGHPTSAAEPPISNP